MALFVGSVFPHLTFPFSSRYLATGLAVIGAPGGLFLALLFAYALIFTSVFAIFLPRLAAVPRRSLDVLSDGTVAAAVVMRGVPTVTSASTIP